MAIEYPIIFRKSPAALVRSIISIDIVLIALFFISILFVDYEELFGRVAFLQVLSYEVLAALLILILQAIISFVALVQWTREHYEIRQRELVFRRGLWKREEKVYLLDSIRFISFSQDFLERKLNYGTIMLESFNSHDKIVIEEISNPRFYVTIFENLIRDIPVSSLQQIREKDFTSLLKGRENELVEFKSTFRWDIRKAITSLELERVVMKTVAGFLNTNGGVVVIGVSDTGEVLGLEHDYKTLPKRNSDSFENHFNQVFNTTLGAQFRHFVQLRFELVDDKEICLIDVRPSTKPVYLKFDNTEEFYIRTGNSTSPLKMSEVATYVSIHWKN
ncbi:MAG: hypothetical protein A3H06_01395 [Candidatus Colwellbacteria bacterium RIFCSPLOWO2_12_FULL_44_13]|uniref:Schlafen AlbA-2 domain-containing protein n=3 Tax=Candidatus Colwelliibacteriota TaxID=1817904 RepID=A0A1G1Z732_9BACT|nr:MAG: hypothetical protein A3F24_03235 [Candidatus Colwellbacteria bacterium RIFCSPHIGHO2_12_FULL_44_17]OGY60442.1 MAG: hypothetical protein A3I31_01090 [Candidatus Colwellbacteria bacterium RIFCSPLOWO2_02_FULL_44_20b]OGY61329.1 MAG: hypothetical protein A3H06_01395 [Candidatus Colwellbacteria bacterium RIFCSPLOWO2_12_FULL_44_13]